jgi:hypothetical protein
VAEAATPDPLVAEVRRWLAYVRDNPATDEQWKATRAAVEPALVQAERALAADQRWYALARLAAARAIVAPVAYLASLPAGPGRDLVALEAEWKRMGPSLTGAAALPSLAGAPAAARAVGEAALSEVAVLYAASLDYGRNTVADSGFYYLGSAQAQLEMARLMAAFGGVAGTPLPVRSVAAELRALEDELLGAYVPPASIEHHPVFIRISALIKQGHELDAAGRHHGALYRLLEARQRLSRLIGPARGIDAAEAVRRGREVAARLRASGADPSFGMLFVEAGIANAADPDPAAKGGETARAIFDDVLPLYFAALGPAPAAPPIQPAAVTVTLLRWPYT